MPSVEKKDFGHLPDGELVECYTLTNSQQMSAKILTYGGTVTELLVPDRAGKFESVVLGFDNLEQYLSPHPRFGAVIGRFANRIAGAQFRLDGQDYRLAANKNGNTLHGGMIGFDKKNWRAESGSNNDAAWLKLSYVSVDMEEGFPGTLNISVKYSVSNKNVFAIEYHATTDKATPVNVTNHSYFNLAGAGRGDVLQHICTFHAGYYTPASGDGIPTGEILSVSGTPFDFRSAAKIGDQIEKTGGGYDHNLVVTGTVANPDDIGTVVDPESGRVLSIKSDQPGFQFFTANGLDGKIQGIGGAYQKHAGFCVETQHFPDSVHQKHFPTTILRPGQIFRSYTEYCFSVIEGV